MKAAAALLLAFAAAATAAPPPTSPVELADRHRVTIEGQVVQVVNVLQEIARPDGTVEIAEAFLEVSARRAILPPPHLPRRPEPSIRLLCEPELCAGVAAGDRVRVVAIFTSTRSGYQDTATRLNAVRVDVLER
jgi:hypothetical protein